MLVREEDLFTQLQAALTRAREDKGIVTPLTTELPVRGPPSTPSQSPMAGLRFTQPDSETQPDTAAIPKAAYSPDFFEDELRGYRLLKAAKLTSSEKQSILTQTSNSTSFLQVRRALRTLFAEEDESGHSWGRRPRIWWTDDQQSWDTVDDTWQCWDAYDPGHATWFADEDEESYWAIALLKGAAGRLLKEVEDMEVELAFTLAAHGQNESIGPSGFSAFQWTRGASIPMEGLRLGIDPKKAFGGMLRLKEKARVAHEMESARQRLSKLNNTIPHKIATHKPGSLVMLWRQRNRPGKVSGGWQGPVRVLLQESQTLWLASGSSIVRARTLQVRPCTRREELQASLEGMAIIKMPVTLESLLRNFTGRHFSDVAGETPSLEAQQEDLSPGSSRRPVRKEFLIARNILVIDQKLDAI